MGTRKKKRIIFFVQVTSAASGDVILYKSGPSLTLLFYVLPGPALCRLSSFRRLEGPAFSPNFCCNLLLGRSSGSSKSSPPPVG